jgi:hypothetical protein
MAFPFPEANSPNENYYWAFKRLLSAVLIPATGAVFESSTSVYSVGDALLGVSPVIHTFVRVRASFFLYGYSHAFTETLHPFSLTPSSSTTSTSGISQRSATAHRGVCVLRLSVFSLASASSTLTTLVCISLVAVSTITLSPSSPSPTTSYLILGVFYHLLTSLISDFLMFSFTFTFGYQTTFPLSSTSFFFLFMVLLFHRSLCPLLDSDSRFRCSTNNLFFYLAFQVSPSS